jgi:hypothetical protein
MGHEDEELSLRMDDDLLLVSTDLMWGPISPDETKSSIAAESPTPSDSSKSWYVKMLHDNYFKNINNRPITRPIEKGIKLTNFFPFCYLIRINNLLFLQVSR